MRQRLLWLVPIVVIALVCSMGPAAAGRPEDPSDPGELIQRRLEEAQQERSHWVRAGKLCEVARECAALGLYEKAEEIATQARRAADKIEPDEWRLRARVFAQLAGTYEKIGQPESGDEMLSMAVEEAEISRQPGARCQMLTTVALQYAEGGTACRASTILDRAFEQAEQAKEYWRCGLFARVAEAFVKLEMEQKAEEIVQRIVVAQNNLFHGEVYRAREIGNRALENVSRAYARQGRYDCATAVAERMRPGEDRRKALASLFSDKVSAMAGCGRYEEALELVQSVSESRASRARETLVNMAVEEGRLDIAEQLAPPHRLVRAYARDGRHALALRIAERNEHAGEKSDALAAIARGCGERGEYERAVRAALRMHVARADQKVEVLHELGLMCMDIPLERQWSFRSVQAGDLAAKRTPEGLRILSHATEAARDIQGAPIRTRLLLKIAGTYLRLGKTEEAADLLKQASEAAEEIYPPYFRSLAFFQIADHYISAGQNHKATGFLQRAQSVAERIEGDTVANRARFLLRTGQQYAKAGRKEKAREVLSLAEEMAGKIKNNYTRRIVLQEIEDAMPGQSQGEP